MSKVIYAIAATLLCVTLYAQTSCAPALKQNQPNFVIGYGSLMQAQSRQRTNPKAQHAYPIMVKGYQRIWGIHGGKCCRTTFLTVIRSSKSKFNAIYYPTTPADILATDTREGVHNKNSGYCRIAVPHKQITALGLRHLPAGKYWIYAKRKRNTEAPSANFPIVQSYVDMFLDGCIQVGQTYQLKNFAQQCITTTSGWPNAQDNNAWINDRLHPRRPFNVPNARKIDSILSKVFNNYYDHPIQK